jgi:citrate lyase subunit beta / citryl-CoA lyase
MSAPDRPNGHRSGRPSDRPRRSVLYMPASNPRALEKAKTLAADTVIFDLEDAVAPDAKECARESAIAAVNSGAYGQREVLIRVNGLDTAWVADDLKAVAKSKADGVVVPKVSTVDDMVQIDNILSAAGAPADFPVWAMMETPRGILSADAIAQSSQRLAGLCIGTADLSKDLQCAHPADRGPMSVSLQLVILAARANGLIVLDGVHVDLQDDAGFEMACRQGRDLGFDGKTLIHPKQIAEANVAFAPSEDEIAHAHRLIAAHEAAQAKGAGVTTLDGRLVEVLHVAEAKRLLAKADMINALESSYS